MALTDILRARVQGAKQAVAFRCGELGELRAQALSPSECAALSRSGDSDRAVFYAACRDLQAAGETLRREGKVFTPDQIMQFVSDEEAKVGADAVRRLSNVGGPPLAGEDAETKPHGAGRTKNAEKNVPSEKSNDAGQTDPAQRQDKDGSVEVGAVTTDEKQKVRRDSVQGFVNQDSEIRPEIVQGKNQSGNTGAPRMVSGQVSREFFGENGPEADNPKKSEKMDKETQTVVVEPGRTAQHVGILRPIQKQNQAKQRKLFLNQTEGTANSGRTRLHESMLEMPEIMHETKSEPGDGLHETKSDFGNGLHESKSESDKNSGAALHETKSEFAEFALRELLNGLRRAAAVR